MRYDSDLLYRPPGEWRSYLLQCTIGCSHNKCTFCAMYKEKKFRVRPVEEILEDIDMARSYYGPNVERVFLMDGDAIVMRTEQLLQILKKLYAAFPKLQKVTTYAGPRSTLSKTPEELRALREAAPDLICITGDFLDSRRTDLDFALELAGQLAEIAPAVYVTGNHEARRMDLSALEAGLAARGVQVLRDGWTPLARGGEEIALIGLDDPGFADRKSVV